ncbi:hypothetical protein K1719_026914 [Acacia pycnantha]|nr:hypothetical protein K1719_026914 [Acacia pycnantha]
MLSLESVQCAWSSSFSVGDLEHLLTLFLISWNFIGVYMKNIWLLLSSRIRKLKRRSFLLHSTTTVETEEDVFWMLAVLLENVLVNDCYTNNLSGCHVEQSVQRLTC